MEDHKRTVCGMPSCSHKRCRHFNLRDCEHATHATERTRFFTTCVTRIARICWCILINKHIDVINRVNMFLVVVVECCEMFCLSSLVYCLSFDAKRRHFAVTWTKQCASHVQDEMEKLMHHDEQELPSLWEG